MKSILSIPASLLLLGASANAALVAGDLTIIGYRADAPDTISFVVWTTVTTSDTIYFTDSGFFSDGTMRDSENVMSWTPTATVGAGTVIVIASPSTTSSANIGTTTGALDGLAAGGDQIFAGDSAFPSASDTTIPGSTYSGNLLFGLDFNGSVGWDASATSSGTSFLPTALAAHNFSIAHVDNAQYTGPRTGLTIAEYKTAIANVGNWTTNDDGAIFGNLSPTAFTIIPEPSTALLGGIGALMLLRRRR